MRYWQSSSEIHKEMLAILAAVTEVIKSKGGKETETEYFAALMTTLDTVDTDMSATAVLSLLSMVIKRLPPAVLKVKFSEVSKTFVNLLGKYMNSDHNAFLRNLIGCLSTLLRAQEIAVWSNSSTLLIYDAVLAFTVHMKPKVRKAAQHAVCSILKASAIMTQINPPSHHPATSSTAKFCISKIEESAASGTDTTALHILGLLKDTLAIFPQANLKICCETILRLMTLGSPIVVSCCFQAFHGMFTRKPKPENLSAELNTQIIIALYDYQPNFNDANPLIAWLSVMKEAFMNLQRLSPQLCISHLPRIFNVGMQCLLSDKSEVHPVAADLLKVLLVNCVQPSAHDFCQMIKGASPGVSTPAHKLFNSIEGGLKYQFHSVWNHVLQILAIFFEVAGKECYPIMIKGLQYLADMRDSIRFAFTADLDKAMGTAIRYMGPNVVIGAVPLQISGKNDNLNFPRSWLLPVLRDNIRETNLGFFTKYFYPLATSLEEKVRELEKENRTVEAKTYNVLKTQIWSLLPGFCTNPTDLVESFKGIARILGTVLNDNPEQRLDVLASLRLLINKAIDCEASRAELSRFAKNYLPILFNLYTTTEDNKKDHVRLAVYETIKVYLKITTAELHVMLYEKAMEKLQEASTSTFKRQALIDITRALLPYLTEVYLRNLYQYCKPLLQDEDRSIQKKAYRVIEELCKSDSNGCTSFVKENLSEFQDLFLSSLSSSVPSSKAPRLRCLTSIVKQLDQEQKEFVVSIVPEAILCTKQNAEKAREAAFDLLITIGYTIKSWNQNNPEEALTDYMQMLLAGLIGSPHLISATILAIGRVMFEFKGELKSSLVHMLMEHICLLLTSKSREIIQSILSFFKILLTSFSSDELVEYVELMVKSLADISEDSQRHFRFKSKELFVRLIRKFGYEMIAKLVPQQYQKLLIYIRKTESRKARKKAMMGEVESDEDSKKIKDKPETIEELLQSSDDDLDMDENEEQKVGRLYKKAKRRNKSSTWIEEKGDEEIVDFLDPTISKKLTTTKPDEDSKKKRKANPDFKLAPDGRIIITDENDDDDNKNVSDSLSDILQESLSLKKSTKRKLDIDEDDFPAPKYQAGGKGIHRPIAIPKMNKNVNYGKDYKSKKAGGDIKKTGKPDPYAYIPLNRQALNKRKKAKFSGQFNNVMKAAKKGAQKGKKMKTKKGRK